MEMDNSRYILLSYRILNLTTKAMSCLKTARLDFGMLSSSLDVS